MHPSDGGHPHELVVTSGALVGSPCAGVPSYWIWSEEEFETLRVSRRCSVALVHVAATYPFGSRRHADLIARAIIPSGGSNRMSPVTVIIARLCRIRPARPTAGVNAVMPIVIVIGS